MTSTPRPDAPSRARTAADLATVVAELVNSQSRTVSVEWRSPVDGHLVIERRDLPVRPLLAELRDGVANSGQSGGSGRGGSRLPLDAEALDVLTTIERATLAMAGQRGLSRRRREQLGRVHWCDDLLRRLAVTDWPDAGLRDAFAGKVRELTSRAELALDARAAGVQYVRGYRCPLCRVESVRELVPGSTPPAYTRHPPLAVLRERASDTETDGRAGPILGTRCTSCLAWWPWAEMQPGGRLYELLDADLYVEWQQARHIGQRAPAPRSAYPAPPSADALGLPTY